MASTSVDDPDSMQLLKSNGVTKKSREIKTRCSIHDPPARRKFMFDSSAIKDTKPKKAKTLKSKTSTTVSLGNHKNAEQPKVKTTRHLPPPLRTKETTPSARKMKSSPPISRSKRKNTLVRKKTKDVSDAARSAAYEAAETHQKSLVSGNPSIVRSMLPSHVSSVFWLGLPKVFCVANLIEKKSNIILEDEHGNEFEVVYIPERNGLSGKWHEFATKKTLHEGDALLFERLGPKRLKVHIFRAAELLAKIQEERASSFEKRKKQRNI